MSSSPCWETINGVRYSVVEIISSPKPVPQQPLQASLVTEEGQQAFVEYVALPATDGETIIFVKKD